MRLLILGNMANDGYAVAKELRKMHYDVDLGINLSDFGMALPQWEDAEFTCAVDPYKFNNEITTNWNKPEWVREFDLLNNKQRKKLRFEKSIRRINLIRFIREYDMIEAHVPYCLFTQFVGRPYVVYDAGWIRYFPHGKTFRDKLARRGYKNAKKIIITNPDTFEIADKLDYMQKNGTVFCPFAIDSNKYKPMNANALREQYVTNDELLLFSPTRQIWSEKGNDKMLYAFAKFVKQHPKTKLVIVSWSIDAMKTKELAIELGVYNKIIWIEPMPKNNLIQHYNAADIVLDQFILGSWGTSTPEAMSCGKPVLIYYNGYTQRGFDSNPPIESVHSVDEITNQLQKLTDADLRKEIGQNCMNWVHKTHSAQKVALKHIEILEPFMRK